MIKKYFLQSAIFLVLLAINISFCFGQTTGSIAGTVPDQSGATVPNATVLVTGASGQQYTVTTSDNGTYRIPAVSTGLYTVTITATGFKKVVTSNVKVDDGTPSTVDTVLEVSDVAQVVEVTTGAEVLQTATPTVSTTISGRQITNTPIASRDALDLVVLMPGTNTVGRPRSSSINGLPKGSISITIDGVDVQDNNQRSAEGFFTSVRPRVDAIEEVTVSTANPGAESASDGAVQIKFITRRGTNDYSGGLFWQHRDEGLNANYWFTNRDGQRHSNGKAYLQKLRLNQYSGRLGGPLPFFRFGEGGKWFDSGKDKAFFFFNYEEFRLPQSLSRTRTILTPEAQAGNYNYIGSRTSSNAPASPGCTIISPTQQQCSINVFNLVANSGVPGFETTADLTVSSLLTRIRTAVGTQGQINAIPGQLNIQNYNFAPTGGDLRKFLALRFDFNLTKSHSLELVTNQDTFPSSKDFLNSQDERFPGFPSYGQGSTRDSYAAALRSSFGQNVVNEFRYASQVGDLEFAPGISISDFDYMGGYSLGINAASFSSQAVTTGVSRNSYSLRSSPVYDWTDNLTWTKGNHSLQFGGQYKRVKLLDVSQSIIAPTVSFGIDANEAAYEVFNTARLPGSSGTQQNEARALYAVLAGRVSGFSSTAYLTDDGTYKVNALQTRSDRQDTYGLYAQDSWRIRPGLTIDYGLRWQPQGASVVETANYASLSSLADAYGISGLGNIFRPGTETGKVPTVVGLAPGTEAYKLDNNNFAPSFGAVWSPDFGDKGFLRTAFGASGTSVFRGGWSRSFVREGTALIGSILGANPGGNLPASRSFALGNITPGTYLRQGASNPNLSPAPLASETPAYPITLPALSSANSFDPNLKTGYVDSFSFNYQRQLDKNTVFEIGYVGTRGKSLVRQHNINEINTIENGVASEFALAQQNLYANVAAGRCQVTATGVQLQDTNSNNTSTYSAGCRYNFAYFGPGTGTSLLPISLAYIAGGTISVPNANNNGSVSISNRVSLSPGALNQSGTVTPTTAPALNPAAYNNALFRNTAFASNLSRLAPTVITFAGNLEGNPGRRTNAIAAGLPSNFFFVNPTSATGGSHIVDNSGESWYDSVVLQVRRRLSNGLRLQANYVWGKALSNAFQSNTDNFAQFTHRDNGLELARNVAVFDIRHAFKMDATYDLPFGKGRTFFSNTNGWVDALVGGFTINPVIRWQSGSPISIGNVQLIGMTVKELQDAVGVYKKDNVVNYLPDDIITNTQRAFTIDPLNTANNGYGTNTYVTAGGPQSRFIAPAGYGNCQQRYTGECGFSNLIIYGPSFFKFDASVSKRITLGEKRNIELRVTALDVLNRPNFRVGGWNADVVTAGTISAVDFGRLGTTSAYQDVSTTNDPGGRLIDLMIRFNF